MEKAIYQTHGLSIGNKISSTLVSSSEKENCLYTVSTYIVVKGILSPQEMLAKQNTKTQFVLGEQLLVYRSVTVDTFW